MAIVNGYCTLAELKASLRITDNVDDSLLEQAIESASRRIDGYCGRFFFKTASTAVLIFNEYFNTVKLPNDLSSTTVTVQTDTAGNGTYSTTLVQGTDYILTPLNNVITNFPYTKILMIGNKTFPVYYPPLPPTVKVTGQWGWDSVPNDIKEACILLAMRQFARLNAALGVVGFADMALQVRAVDPDVRDLLNPYRTFGIA